MHTDEQVRFLARWIRTEVPVRHLLILPAFALVLGCGSSKLSRSAAEKDLRQGYPVIVDIRVPASAGAIKGSPEHAKLVALQEQLSKAGWLSVERRSEGDREQFTFSLTPGAPKDLRTTAKGFSIPAAEAQFVKTLRLGSVGGETTVTYRIRLAKPTAQFGVFQALHPEVRIGDTKERHARYRREGRAWVLQGTDEVFRQAE